MAAILLNPDVVIFKDPMGKNAHQFRWWSERGMIHWEDQVTGEYGSQTVRTTLQRMQGLQDMISNSRGKKGWANADEVNAYQEYIDQMLAICKKAQQQGMPDDPNHTKQMAAKIKADRQSRFVVLPGLASF